MRITVTKCMGFFSGLSKGRVVKAVEHKSLESNTLTYTRKFNHR